MANDNDFQSYSASRQVLGCLIVNPFLLIEHKIDKTYFADAFHQIIFYAIQNSFANGATKNDASTISAYLKENFPGGWTSFKNNNGVKFIQEITNPKFLRLENFEANYKELVKFALLRDLHKQHFPVDMFYDPDDVLTERIEKRRKYFESLEVSDILKYYKSKLVTLTDKFNIKNGIDQIKAGSDKAKEQKEKWKQAPDMGLSYASNYYTTVTLGMREKRFVISSAPSGTGKSRISIANLCHSFVPRYYDKKQGAFIDNPHGKQNAALYIGTEMELIEEIEPILWAYIADVPEQHITQNQYDPGEEERVDEAIKILDEEAQIYLAYIPEYDTEALENCIETHVNKYGVRHVIFDYIHITTDLIAEFQDEAKARMTVREDQVLANLSTKLKELVRKYNISLDTWTQTNREVNNDQNRDSSVVRGASAIIDKVDTASVTTWVTEKEKRLLEPITRTMIGKPIPNVCISVYKNRGGIYNRVKIWLYIEYSTMRVKDLFVTDYDYKRINMEPTYTYVEEDVVKSTNSKKDVRKLMQARSEAIEIMQQVAQEDPTIYEQIEKENELEEQRILDEEKTYKKETNKEDLELEEDFDY